jgi:hypothetical protein
VHHVRSGVQEQLLADLEAEFAQSRAHLIEVNRQAFRRGEQMASASACMGHSHIPFHRL